MERYSSSETVTKLIFYFILHRIDETRLIICNIKDTLDNIS